MSPLIAFLTLFFLVPIAILLVYSFGYSNAVTTSFGLNIANYQSALTTGIYWAVMVRALVIGLITASLCVVIAFPFVYAIVLGPLRRHSELFLFAVLLSLFSSYVVRVYAWRSLLGDQGVINTTLKDLHLVNQSVSFLLFSTVATVITLVNVLLPFAVLPMYASMIQVDPLVIEAARDLGANGARSALKIALPLASQGVNGGFALCFIIAAGDYVTPQLVGGANSQMIGNVIAGQFGVAFNWPLGAALTFVFLLLMALVLVAWIFITRISGLRGALR
jgi:spermidine/putrescine transport system permease protein